MIAVEPLAEMRERLAENVPLAVPFDVTAERMALRDGSAHAITVAQAFHWFDGDRALTEFHRVLAPRGKRGPRRIGTEDRITSGARAGADPRRVPRARCDAPGHPWPRDRDASPPQDGVLDRAPLGATPHHPCAASRSRPRRIRAPRVHRRCARREVVGRFARTAVCHPYAPGSRARARGRRWDGRPRR